MKGQHWLATVIPRADLIANSKALGIKRHFGELITICSIKYFERSEEYWKYKGRIVFRGDVVKDEYGAAAVFQELSASPTTVQSANPNLAYGCLLGNKTTQADAVRAYIQALLDTVHETWVLVPTELWPKH